MGAAIHYPLPAITTLKNGMGFRSVCEKLNRFLGLGPCLGNKGAGTSVTLCSSDSANGLLRAGEMGQRLRAWAALLYNLGLLPGTHTVAHNHHNPTSLVRHPRHGYQACTWCTEMQTKQNTFFEKNT